MLLEQRAPSGSMYLQLMSAEVKPPKSPFVDAIIAADAETRPFEPIMPADSTVDPETIMDNPCTGEKNGSQYEIFQIRPLKEETGTVVNVKPKRQSLLS